jgi:hypothetical protein
VTSGAVEGILVAHGFQELYANDIHNIDGGLHRYFLDRDREYPTRFLILARCAGGKPQLAAC